MSGIGDASYVFMNTNTSHHMVARKVLMASAVIAVLSFPIIALGDATPHSVNSMMADSPITSYTAGVMLYMLLVGFLVTFLLGGAFAVLNLGLMSKRDSDSGLGNRDPSDVAILKNGNPNPILPAEEGEIENPLTQVDVRRNLAEGAVLVTEEAMYHDERQFEQRRAA